MTGASRHTQKCLSMTFMYILLDISVFCKWADLSLCRTVFRQVILMVFISYPHYVPELGTPLSQQYYIRVIGMVAATALRQLVSYIRDSKPIGDNCNVLLMSFNPQCLAGFFDRRNKNIVWYAISHMAEMLFSLITVVPFFVMEDMYSAHEGSTIMRDCLILGTVLEIMHSAFSVGIRSASGMIASLYKPIEGKGDPYPVMYISYNILQRCFTWVTFLRDLILSIGIYMTYVYDKTEEVIGGTWRVMGVISAIMGLVTCLLEFLKLVQYSFFNDYSNITYYIFLAAYLVWLYIFGNHCASLVAVEEKSMLDSDASSGADVSEEDAMPTQSMKPKEVSEDEEEKEVVVEKKKKHRSKKVESSEDDV